MDHASRARPARSPTRPARRSSYKNIWDGIFVSFSMFANALFHDTEGEERGMLETFVIGLITSLITLVPTTIIVLLFRRTKEPTAKAQQRRKGSIGQHKIEKRSDGDVLV